MRAIFLVLLFVAGCETSPPQPSPARLQLEGACSGGDTDACGVLLDAEQRQADARAAVAMAYLANRRPAYTPQTVILREPMQIPPPAAPMIQPIPLSVMAN
jgi:hypothetical protein